MEFLSLNDCLDAIGLSAARVHSWTKRQIRCLLTDYSPCPKPSPTRLTANEANEIKELVTLKDYAHLSIPSLVWFARREAKVFASLSCWYRVSRDFGLRRAMQRIYPPKPKNGVRAPGPNQI